MPVLDQTQIMEKQQASTWFLFSCAASASMFLVIAIASCTSSDTFSHIYSAVAEFLSLSRTTLSATLRASPNLGHFLCYSLLSLSLCGVLSTRSKYSAPLVAAIFGIIMEIVQMFIPSRDASVFDIGFNVLGIALGFGIYRLWVVFKRRSVQAHVT